MNFVAILIDVTIVKYVWKPVKHFGIEKHSNFLNSISIRLTAKQKKTKEAIKSKVFCVCVIMRRFLFGVTANMVFIRLTPDSRY